MKAKPHPHLRLTLRQPNEESLGAFSIVKYDGLDACDAEGNVLVDLQRCLHRAEVIREVGGVARVVLELYGVDIREEHAPEEAA